MVFILFVSVRSLVVTAVAAQEDEAHQSSGEKHGKPCSERGRDHHVDMRALVAPNDQQNRDCGHDDREQRHPLHDAPEFLEHRDAWARNGVRTGHGLFFGFAKWDYQGLHR